MSMDELLGSDGPDTFRLTAAGEGRKREATRLRAEVERLRSGIADLRAGLMRGCNGGRCDPLDMTPLAPTLACLDALTREDGEG